MKQNLTWDSGNTLSDGVLQARWVLRSDPQRGAEGTAFSHLQEQNGRPCATVHGFTALAEKIKQGEVLEAAWWVELAWCLSLGKTLEQWPLPQASFGVGEHHCP